jgi:hypothetical protein
MVNREELYYWIKANNLLSIFLCVLIMIILNIADDVSLYYNMLYKFATVYNDNPLFTGH